MNILRLGLAVVAIVSAGSSCSNSASLPPCSKYAERGEEIVDLLSQGSSVLEGMYRPCGGRGDPKNFSIPTDVRRASMGEGAECYEEAESALEVLVVGTVETPDRGSVFVEVTSGEWTLAKYEITSEGWVRTYGGEPAYGYSREMTAPRGEGMRDSLIECGGYYQEILEGGVWLVAPFINEEGDRLGEVRLHLMP